MNVFDRVGKILLMGATQVAAAGAAVPLHGVIDSTGTIALVAGSAVVEGTSTNFSDDVADVAAGILFLKTAGGNVYKIKKVIDADTIQLFDLAVGTETGVSFKLYRMYDCVLIVVSVATVGNTNGAWIGDSSVDRTSKIGIHIENGASFFVPASSLLDFWIDVDTSNNIVSWVLFK